MLLGEPPRTPYDLNFTVFGIPVRVHPLFWLVTLMLGYHLRDVASVLAWVIAVFIAITVHELGHAAVMRAYGFCPWITLYGMGGLASHDQGYASHSKGSTPLGQILICLAGPAAGFLLAALLLLALFLLGYREQIYFIDPWGLLPYLLLPDNNFAQLLNFLFFCSVLWGLINLLPIYPLDGGQIAREILLQANPREGIRQSLLLSTFAAGGMAAYGVIQWGSWFVAILFGYLAFSSYAALQAYNNSSSPW